MMHGPMNVKFICSNFMTVRLKLNNCYPNTLPPRSIHHCHLPWGASGWFHRPTL